MNGNSCVNNPEYYNVFERDRSQRIDYVLVHKNDDNEKHNEIRSIFERNLIRKFLLLEKFEDSERKLTFVKIHTPNIILKHYCEILKIRIPVKDDIQECLRPKQLRSSSKLQIFFGYILTLFLIPTKWIQRKSYKLTAEFSKHKEYLFNDAITFSTSDRCMITNFILERVLFKNIETSGPLTQIEIEHNAGIRKLLEKGVYEAAYPPHEGDLSLTENYERNILLKEWASWKCIFKQQPLDKIKDYFGIKFALYFAWLGFYTYMLVSVSILGFLSILYGYFTQNSDILSTEICNPTEEILMCPECDKYCDYWDIKEACYYYQVRYYFENDATILFALVMSVWSALYLKMWKVYSAEITHRWGLTGYTLHAEHPRPDYRKCEPWCWKRNEKDSGKNTPCFYKIPIYVFTYAIILFMIALVVAIIFALIMYNIWLSTSDYIYGSDSNKYKRTLFIPITSSVLNLISIALLNTFYDYISIKLTNLEFQRTQVEFENSLQFKIYLFQFVNYYAPLFYIAFIKGNFIGYPAKYTRLFGYRQEECEAGGCFMEIFIEVLIFMIGEQLWEKFCEYVWPYIRLCFIRKKYSNSNDNNQQDDIELPLFSHINDKQGWKKDYDLMPWENTELLGEYLEMIIQYGFVTMFFVAFPLAPLLALVNNLLIELRFDAIKFIKKYQRPIGQRVPDIGAWFNIMKVIAKLAVLTNACIIAFSTNFIPMLLYRMNYGTKSGFLNYSLSVFKVNDLEIETRPENSSVVTQICRYPAYRYPPDHEQEYEWTFEHWHLLTAKLLFIILFENFVSVIVMIYQWCVPDMPNQMSKQIDDEDKYIMNKVIDNIEVSNFEKRINSSARISMRNK